MRRAEVQMVSYRFVSATRIIFVACKHFENFALLKSIPLPLRLHSMVLQCQALLVSVNSAKTITANLSERSQTVN
jgi:hypothetical protein